MYGAEINCRYCRQTQRCGDGRRQPVASGIATASFTTAIGERCATKEESIVQNSGFGATSRTEVRDGDITAKWLTPVSGNAVLRPLAGKRGVNYREGVSNEACARLSSRCTDA